jgi:hypothetical protein
VSRRRAPAPNAWSVEVLRTWIGGSPEAVLYGCWYTPLLEPFPRGTGMFTHTGELISCRSKQRAKTWARVRAGQERRSGNNNSHCAVWPKAPKDLVALAKANGPGGRRESIFWLKK